MNLKEKEQEATGMSVELLIEGLHILDDMPMAFSAVEVLVDEAGEPFDFRYLYTNRRHSQLEEAGHGNLVGKRFFEYYHNGDRKWLLYYHDTAYHGRKHEINDYSPELEKYLLIYTYQLAPGICGCVIQDMTKRRKLEIELEKNTEQMNLLLRVATDTIFNYDLETNTLYASEQDIHRYGIPPKVHNVPDGLVEEGLLSPISVDIFRENLKCLERGEHEVSFDIQARLRTEEPYHWYNCTFIDYTERYTDKRKILSYLKNVDGIVNAQRELLKNEVELDPLTGIYNVRTGKKMIINRLENFDGNGYQMLFLMDLDDFKNINDSEGHQMGDKVLIAFAEILKKIFRSDDVVYRLGGDEFAAFVGNISEPEEAVQSIMLRFYSELNKVKFPNIALKSSVGVFISSRKHKFDHFYSEADKALYQTKIRGKNNFTEFWDEEGEL